MPAADGGGNLRIFLNGVESTYLAGFTPTDLSWPAIVDTVNSLMNVGRDPGDGSRFFDGLMDDIAWFDGVLTSAERADIRNNGVGGSALAGDSRLIAHWNLDDAPGTTEAPGDSGTGITLLIQQEPPLPPIEGFGIVAPANVDITSNLFHEYDVDSNQPLDGSNKFGDPQFVNIGATPADVYTIQFGSPAAFMSTEFMLDANTPALHIGAYQDAPRRRGAISSSPAAAKTINSSSRRPAPTALRRCSPSTWEARVKKPSVRFC